MSDFDVIIATIGKAHGLRGEVALILRTDRPEDRLERGTVFEVDAADAPSELTIAGTRTQQGRWYARFAEVTDRSGAEALRGIELTARVDADQEAEEDPDAWYPSQLVGLEVVHVNGDALGKVVDLEHYPAQDLLIVATPDRRRVMLPLVRELVPEVDLDAGVVRANPPGGLFEDSPDDADEDA